MTTTTTTTNHRADSSLVDRLPLAVVSLGAVVAGAIVTTGFEFLVRAVGIGLEAGSNPGDDIEAIPEGGFFGGVVFWGAIGIVIALVIARYARSPRTTWTKSAWVLTAVSLAMPMVVPTDGIATNLALAASHVVAAAVIIPMIARRMPATGRR